MVQISTTTSRVDDTARKVLENRAGCLYSDTVWTNLLEDLLRERDTCGSRLARPPIMILERNLSIGCHGSIAGSCRASVWVVGTKNNRVVHSVREGWTIVTTIATICSRFMVAVDKLLL
jgi:hypothetical protein